ncbi:glycosyltransferase [Dethiothermospora halolimnae]|uniref:glycosyltransferase n=1 Tax=Dethiothermospora halolimnae TaxID=3114390 RepID=UPI003CCC3439
MYGKDIKIKININEEPVKCRIPSTITKPVNNYPSNLVKKSLKNNFNIYSKKSKDKSPGVTIITSTKRNKFIDRVFDNYKRQNYSNKELIIILNKNDMDLSKWKKKSEKYNNIRIFKVDENEPLGVCLNFGVTKRKYDYMAKFDDDDYYGPDYLVNMMEEFKNTDAHIIGKDNYFVYFENDNILAVRKRNKQNRFVNHVAGSTLVIKKEVLNKVKFDSKLKRGVDTKFLKDCKKQGFKIYSSDKYNHVVCRRPNLDEHTWQISQKDFLRTLKYIAHTDNFEPYVVR